MDLSVLPGFIAMILVFLAPPGPDMAYMIAMGLQGGRRAALRAILGIGTGMSVYAALVALGLGRVVERWPLVLVVVKLGGAAYLLWLAWHAWRDAPHAPEPGQTPGGRPYLRGCLVSLANPKVILFFLAVLPQFVGRATSPGAQLALLGAVNVATEVVLYGGIGALAGTLQAKLGRSRGAASLLARAAAVVYLALAVVVVIDATRG